MNNNICAHTSRAHKLLLVFFSSYFGDIRN